MPPFDPYAGQFNNDSSSLLGQYGMDYAQGAGGLAPDSPALSILQNMPSAWVTTGWNSMRGARTIMRGGFDEGLYGRTVGSIGRRTLGNIPGVRRIRGSNPLRPRSFGRMSNQDMLHGNETSPLNFAAGLGNRGANMVAKSAIGRLKAGEDSKLAEFMINRNILTPEMRTGMTAGKDQDFLSRGLFARAGAAQKLSRKGVVGGRKLRSVNRFIGLDSDLSGAMGGMSFTGGQDLSHLTMASMKGTASQYMGGYLRGAVTGGPSTEVRSVLETAGKKAYLGGVDAVGGRLAKAGLSVEGGMLKATTAEAIEKFGAKEGGKVGMMAAARFGGAEVAGVMGARAVGMAIPGVNAVMTAMMVYDITKMGIGLMKGAVQTAADAGKSFKGSIEKGVMGGGYRDTTVAATSRQRGVMAIQNSQLNARSVIGSEASMMAAHFG